ncbi:hypothetical protein JCM10908_005313 [Rhodotorula pacifica]|uniref:uncharacterized protein n=1 Tax=Rhodotorula pacifica TaxID=1495444 RepID=UPI00316F3251
MQHPLRSLSGTPDSATGWDAVDREIEQLAQQSRPNESSKTFSKADRELSNEAPPTTTEGRDETEHDSSEDAEALHAEAEQYTKRPVAVDRTRRMILLACACCLSIGSHYATYDLGPIKNSLGTSESGFAGFVSAIELANTVTPLVAGFLVAKLGAAVCGLVATGLVFGGQIIVYIAQSSDGGAAGNLPLMVLGLLVFGAGTSPLAVVQESIILKHNDSSSKFVARSIAAGLVLGKAGSFAGAWSSKPLYTISPHLPFVVASSLSLFSFSTSMLYALVERRASGSHRAAASRHGKDAANHGSPVRLSALAYFGSPFWWYMGVCVLAGMWYTTEHLSSHLLQSVYLISEAEASPAAALVLGAPLLCYPLLGYFLDRHPDLLDKFWLAVPSLISLTYFSYLLLVPVVPALLAIIPAALGVGSGTLLLVLVVPRLVAPDQAATALGAHKSIEMAGAIIVQTLCGRLLGHGRGAHVDEDPTWAISLLLAVSLAQVGVVARWWSVIRQRGRLAAEAQTEEELGLLGEEPELASPEPADYRCLYAAGAVVVLSWVCFLSNLV